MEKIIGTVPGKCRKKREKARLTLNNNPEISWHMKKSRRTYNGVHLNKKSNTQDVVEQSLTGYQRIDGLFRLGKPFGSDAGRDEGLSLIHISEPTRPY